MILTRLVSGLLVGLAVIVFSSALAFAQHDAPGEPAGTEHATEAPAHNAEDDSEHGGDGAVNTDPLEFQVDLALWTGVIFLLLLLILWKFAWGPIAAGLDRREQGIADQISSAQRTNQDARKLLDEYQEKLAQSREEIRQMFDDAKRDAQKAGDQLVEAARGEARAEHQRALAEIELATDGAIKELARRSATLAVDLAGKIVDARLDPKTHARLIEEAVAGFSRPEPNNN